MKIVSITILTLLFSVFAVAQKPPIVVYLAGDSTMAEKTSDKRPETGWGERLQSQFDDSKVKIENHAQNGRSTKSFIDEGRWQAIVDKLKKGDYVFIEFGHNDQKKEDPKRFTDANTDYRNNLIKFVNDVRAKKAFPILLTPIVRRRFNEKDEFYDTHGEYPDSVRKVAAEYKVFFIDMHRQSKAILKNYGAEKSRTLFLQLKVGENPNYPNGAEDNTHFSPLGAEEMAKLAVAGIRKTKIKLRKYLK